jgi:hypothetical protein
MTPAPVAGNPIMKLPNELNQNMYLPVPCIRNSYPNLGRESQLFRESESVTVSSDTAYSQALSNTFKHTAASTNDGHNDRINNVVSGDSVTA